MLHTQAPLDEVGQTGQTGEAYYNDQNAGRYTYVGYI